MYPLNYETQVYPVWVRFNQAVPSWGAAFFVPVGGAREGAPRRRPKGCPPLPHRACPHGSGENLEAQDGFPTCARGIPAYAPARGLPGG